MSYQEGEFLGDITAVMEFPSSDAAHAWESSAQYQAIVKVRTQNTTSPFVIIDGVPE
ncbi:MAG: hypothetical protein CL879_12655 [Dehalococcoidia bacterium]|nr:hypothetical protein [Dehalococcoidia bacterium]